MGCRAAFAKSQGTKSQEVEAWALPRALWRSRPGVAVQSGAIFELSRLGHEGRTLARRVDGRGVEMHSADRRAHVEITFVHSVSAWSEYEESKKWPR